MLLAAVVRGRLRDGPNSWSSWVEEDEGDGDGAEREEGSTKDIRMIRERIVK